MHLFLSGGSGLLPGKSALEQVHHRFNRNIEGPITDPVMSQRPLDHVRHVRGNVRQLPLPVKLGDGSASVEAVHVPGQPIDFLKSRTDGGLGLIPRCMQKGHGHESPHGQSGLGNLVQFAVKLNGFGRSGNRRSRGKADPENPGEL